MNMILHNDPYATIKQGDTLNDPQYKDDSGNLQTFDFVVANPPFSTKSWLKGAKEEDQYKRWGSSIGIPPEKTATTPFCSISFGQSNKQDAVLVSFRTVCYSEAMPKRKSVNIS